MGNVETREQRGIDQTRSALAAWCEEMALADEGRLALSNIIHDKRRGRLPPALIGEFLRRVVDHWASEREAGADFIDYKPALRAFETVRRTMIKENRPIRCQGLPKISTSAECAHITPHERFLELIDRTKAGWNYAGNVKQ